MSDATNNRFYREPTTPGVVGDPKDMVRAVQLTENADWEAIAAWCGGKLINHRGVDDEYTTELRLQPSGLGAFEGAWIVRNDHGGIHIVSGDTWPFGEQKSTATSLVDTATTKLAEANGQQARFWGDHFAEVEKANRDALGAHHKPGHTVAELIAAVVGELADVRASREAWVLEADRLDVIATAARYYVQPDTCDGSDCDHDDDVCVHMDELHATYDDANAARLVPWLETERERLLTIAARYAELSLAVADALHVSASTSNDDLIAMLDLPFKAGSDTAEDGAHQLDPRTWKPIGDH